MRPLRLVLGGLALTLLQAQNCTTDNLGNLSPGPTSFTVSIGPELVQSDGDSSAPSTSADGRYVVFASRATNLAPPTSGFKEIFLRDRLSDTLQNLTKLGQLNIPGNAADCDNPYISPNGQFVTFECTGALTNNVLQSPAPTTKNIFVMDLATRTLHAVVYLGTVPMSTNLVWPDGDCTDSTISNDGKIISFHTSATNIPNCTGTSDRIVAANVTAGFTTSIVYTLISHAMGSTTVNANNGSYNPRLSSNGKFITFSTTASNLTADPIIIGVECIYVAAPDGTGMTLVSRANMATGAPADKDCASPSISGDGRYIAFGSFGGGNLVPGATTSWVIRRDMTTNTNTLVGPSIFMFELFGPPAGTDQTGVSDDGRVVTFTAFNAAQTDLEVTVVDLQAGTFVVSVSVITPGVTFQGFPKPALSADGQWVFWSSNSSLQVIGTTNASLNIFGYGPIP